MNIVQEQQQEEDITNIRARVTTELWEAEGDLWYIHSDGGRRKYKSRHMTNNGRMFVDGKYVPQTHPLYKAGRYKSFNDAAFSSFTNYSQSTKGDVYIITNSAWPEWIKVGKAIDATDRLKSYQTGDPHRSYSLRYSVNLDNRHTSEIKAHKALELISDDRRNEWFKIDLSTAVKCLGGLDG